MHYSDYKQPKLWLLWLALWSFWVPCFARYVCFSHIEIANLQCSHKKGTLLFSIFALFLLPLSDSQYNGSGFIFSVALFSFFLFSLLQQSCSQSVWKYISKSWPPFDSMKAWIFMSLRKRASHCARNNISENMVLPGQITMPFIPWTLDLITYILITVT